MEPFKETAKMLCWVVLAHMLVLPLLMKVSVSAQLVANSVACVALGALYAVVIKADGKRARAAGKDDEIMQMSDALKFPIQASVALLVLYVLFSNIDSNILLTVFKMNFGILGATCIGAFLHDRLHVVVPGLQDRVLVDRQLRILGEEQKIHLTTHSLASYGIGTAVSFLYIVTDHWTLNNVLGIAFTLAGISLLKVQNFKIVLLLLWILFFYDIFWVFASDVMVTVATKFDVPIKLKFPNKDRGGFSILGLGDMVIPGLLLALAIKFDVDSALENLKGEATKIKPKEGEAVEETNPSEPTATQNNTTTAQVLASTKPVGKELNISTPVFYSTLIGYAVGIVATLLGMAYMSRAQPALLYLVPTCTIGVLAPVIAQGRFKEFWNYTSEVKEKDN